MEKTQTVEAYIEAWNQTDSILRLSDLKRCFAENGSYVDAHISETIVGFRPMNDLISAFRSKLQHQLFLTSKPEFHHNVFRLKWKLEFEKEVLSNGTFVGQFNEINLISQIIGFIDNN